MVRRNSWGGRPQVKGGRARSPSGLRLGAQGRGKEEARPLAGPGSPVMPWPGATSPPHVYRCMYAPRSSLSPVAPLKNLPSHPLHCLYHQPPVLGQLNQPSTWYPTSSPASFQSILHTLAKDGCLKCKRINITCPGQTSAEFSFLKSLLAASHTRASASLQPRAFSQTFLSPCSFLHKDLAQAVPCRVLPLTPQVLAPVPLP